MATFTPPDYLRDRAPMPDFKFASSALLREEMARIEKGVPARKGVDEKRYNVAAPSEDRTGDTAEWQSSVDNAKAQLEHQRNHLTNLELLGKFGQNTWKLRSSDLEGLKQRFVCLMLPLPLLLSSGTLPAIHVSLYHRTGRHEEGKHVAAFIRRTTRVPFVVSASVVLILLRCHSPHPHTTQSRSAAISISALTSSRADYTNCYHVTIACSSNVSLRDQFHMF